MTWHNGYFIVLGAMAGLALGMPPLFKLQGWIGTPPPPVFKTDTYYEPPS